MPPPFEKPRHGRQLHCVARSSHLWDPMHDACALLVQAASLDDVACPPLDQLDLLLVSAGTAVPSVISAASSEARRAGEAAPCQQHYSATVNRAARRLWKCMTLWGQAASEAAGHSTALLPVRYQRHRPQSCMPCRHSPVCEAAEVHACARGRGGDGRLPCLQA